MLRQISILTKAQLCNFLGINVLRYTKDKKKKSNSILLGVVWGMLILMMAFYIAMLSFAYILMGMNRGLPMCLMLLTSIVILFFGILKAGSMIFQKDAYEVLCSLPVSQTAIVTSRFLTMYLSNLLLSIVVLAPGMLVYGIMLNPDIRFYVYGIIGALFLPMLPMTIATLVGAVVTGISSRMKHKSLVATALSLIMVVGIILLSNGLTANIDMIDAESMEQLPQMIETLVAQIYPLAAWVGNSMVDGKIGYLFLYILVSVAIFVVMVCVVSRNFQNICRRLYSTSAKHNYKLRALKKDSVRMSLLKKEFKRYFASSVYTTNTIVGPVMMAVLTGTLYFVGAEELEATMGMENIIVRGMPFAMAAISCLMTTTSVSISMEGKEWWIVKSMPVDARTVFDSKILLNLIVIAPFYVISEVFLMLALTPTPLEALWLIFLPIVLMVFACVFGITINIKFPVFDWENEATVVKQGASAMIGGFGGCIIIIISAVPVFTIGLLAPNLARLLIMLVMIVATCLLYKYNTSVRLTEIG